jgi:putative nucleotidyltransferase with HDIG domain
VSLSSRLHGVAWRDRQVKSKDLAYLEQMERLLERRLPYVRGRADRLACITHRLGEYFGLDERARIALAIGTHYHDLGLAGIPDRLLLTDQPLSPDERKTVNDHVGLGGHLLNLGYADDPDVMDIVWFHHERQDGTGPLHLQGKLIPVTAQITALADAVESMYQGRPHRSPMAPSDIVAELQRCAGTQFDPQLVRLLSRNETAIFTSLATLQAAARESAPPNDGTEPAPATGQPGLDADTSPAALNEAAPGADQLQRLTTLPTALCEVLMLAGDAHADRQALAKAIRQDVVLSAATLALANSSTPGPRRGKIVTITEAVAHAGFGAFKHMAERTRVVRTVARTGPGTVSYAKLWEHSFATALIAARLAADDSAETREAFYLGGLLHDLGKFALLEFHPQHVATLLGVRDREAEVRSLGRDHAQLGAEVLSTWNIPQELVAPVAEHHADLRQLHGYDDRAFQIIQAVQLADGLAVALGFESGFLDYVPRLPAELLARFPAIQGLDPQPLRAEIQKHMREIKSRLGVFEESGSAAPPASAAEPPRVPDVSYVLARPLRFDLLLLWLTQARGYTVRTHTLDDGEPERELRAPLIIALDEADAASDRIARVRPLLDDYSGVVITAPACADALAVVPGGWLLLSMPLALPAVERSLFSALRRSGETAEVAHHPAAQRWARSNDPPPRPTERSEILR